MQRATGQKRGIAGSPEYGSWLLGTPGEAPRKRRVRIQLLMTGALVAANLIGIIVAIVLVVVAVPEPSVFSPDVWWVSIIVAPAYILLALVTGVAWLTGRTVKALRWATEHRAPTREDQRRTLATPARVSLMNLVLWLVGDGLLTLLYGLHDPSFIPKIALVVFFCGVVVSAACYLFTEFALRPIAALALDAGRPPGRLSSGITGRIMSTWMFTTGIPVAGIMFAALFTIILHNLSATQLSVTVLFIAGFAMVFGSGLMWVAAWMTSNPVRTVRQAMGRVEQGDLSPTLQVFDGTELGELQRGFNSMVAGLRERERIRDLFGRHVGREVAAAAESKDLELGGEERFAATMFVDIIGSTSLAISRPATEVVDLLNRFFAVIVEEVDAQHGFINKFEGDGCLAVFGTPNHVPCPQDSALAAARSIQQRLREELAEVDAGIGVSAGRVVAGNVGAHERFEYTVIGDAVNTAARLCELSKSVSGRLLATAETVRGASPEEQQFWENGQEIVLRGRDQPTRLAMPI
ncbi:hypothetical protein MBRU_12985 [Mycolicibacterium brumae DSM 44177]|nr:hypothetical protein MBRU_12985 [Mycolicibacterium brumae DSM 44177]